MYTLVFAAQLAVVQPASTAAQCYAAYEQLEYRAAAEACATSIGLAGAAELPMLYQLLAASLAAMGDEAGATSAYESLLALAPEVRLPAEISPRIRAPFEVARRNGAGVPVHLSAVASERPTAGSPLRLRVLVKDGPTRPVTRVVSTSSGRRWDAARTEDPVRLVLPAPEQEGRLLLEISALDRFGGRLAASSVDLEVAAPPRSVLLSWKLWGGAALAFAAAGLGVGLASQYVGRVANAREYADQAAADATVAARAASVANISYAIAGLLAAGAVACIVTEP